MCVCLCVSLLCETLAQPRSTPPIPAPLLTLPHCLLAVKFWTLNLTYKSNCLCLPLLLCHCHSLCLNLLHCDFNRSCADELKILHLEQQTAALSPVCRFLISMFGLSNQKSARRTLKKPLATLEQLKIQQQIHSNIIKFKKINSKIRNKN